MYISSNKTLGKYRNMVTHEELRLTRRFLWVYIGVGQWIGGGAGVGGESCSGKDVK